MFFLLSLGRAPTTQNAHQLRFLPCSRTPIHNYSVLDSFAPVNAHHRHIWTFVRFNCMYSIFCLLICFVIRCLMSLRTCLVCLPVCLGVSYLCICGTSNTELIHLCYCHFADCCCHVLDGIYVKINIFDIFLFLS